MQNWNVISSSSDGNCVIYRDIVMVDLGIKKKDFNLLKPFIDKVKIILITHRHVDHLELPMMKHILKEYPHIRFAYGRFVKEWLDEKLVYRKKGETHKFDILKETILVDNQTYNFGLFKLMPIKLYHDVPNYGFYLNFIDENAAKGYYDLFHGTDSYTFKGIGLPTDIDLVALEHHHLQDHYDEVIERKIDEEVYSHEIGANNSHHSFDDALIFLEESGINKCDVLRLHISTDDFYKGFPIHYVYERKMVETVKNDTK